VVVANNCLLPPESWCSQQRYPQDGLIDEDGPDEITSILFGGGVVDVVVVVVVVVVVSMKP